MGEKEEPVEACELRSLLLCKLTGLGVAAPEVEVEAVEWVGHAAKMHHCCLCWARGHGHLLAPGVEVAPPPQFCCRGGGVHSFA